METGILKLIKPYIYLLITIISTLRGILIKDEEIVICSLLVMSMCVIFLLKPKKGV